MMRNDGRGLDKLRKISITRNYIKHAEGSCLIEFGDTKVICTATVEETVPPFLKGTGTGWVTAEYGMLPRATQKRLQREKSSGRTYEIQRLIGRSLRAVVNTSGFGERTIKVDCDVIQADGGTRTTAITGGFIALADAFIRLKKNKIINKLPITDYLAAISVGIVERDFLLDLSYEEDSKAEVDMNVVMNGEGKFIEIQGTGERDVFTKEEMDKLVSLAQKGIQEIINLQRNILGDIL